MKLIMVLIVGTAIFAFTAILKILLNKISQKYSSWNKLNKLFPAVGTVLWTGFVFWGTGILFREKQFYPYVVLVMGLIVVGLITWFFIRDVFAGALFRMQNDLNQDDYIKIGDLSGQFKSTRLTHLEIISDNGQKIKIPYTRLNQEIISDTSTPEGMEEFNIQLSIDKRFTKPEIEKRIKTELANSPWSSFKNPPVIKFKSEDGNTYKYEVQIYTLNQQHLRIVEKTLEKKMENWKADPQV